MPHNHSYLPARIHDLSGKPPAVTRFLVIGDVHGCADELQQLLERAAFYDDDDMHAVFVGDLVDRGPKILETLQLVHRLHTNGRASVVMGNHDERALRWAQGNAVRMTNGRARTVEQAGPWILSHVQWFEQSFHDIIALPPAPDGAARIVVHAGIDPDVPVTAQQRAVCLFMRGMDHDHLRDVSHGYWFDYPSYEHIEVFYGHIIGPADDPMPRIHRHENARGGCTYYGIDGGCVFGDRLVGMIVSQESPRTIVVQSRYVPDPKSRDVRRV